MKKADPQGRGVLGFTIIELLVTVGVIALLATMLLGVVAKAKESARTVICANNNRQLALGFGLYAEDNRGRIPSFNNWLFGIGEVGPPRRLMTWDGVESDIWFTELAWGIRFGRVYPYVESKAVYMCATDRSEMRKSGGNGVSERLDRALGYGGWGAYRESSYGMSCMTCHMNDLAKWQTPAVSTLLGEALFATNDCSGIARPTPVVLPGGKLAALAFRHGGSGFVVRGDLHVDKVNRNKNGSFQSVWRTDPAFVPEVNESRAPLE